MIEYAPIVLFVYNRVDHTKKTLEALKRNTLSLESNLYIFCDGPKHTEDISKVDEVIKLAESTTGFKSVNVIKSSRNIGLAKSVIDGVSKIIEIYGKVIVLEDDLISSEIFLEYANEALDLYENNQSVWSISGYTPNIKIPSNYSHDIYLSYRACSWGWATWENRWNKIDWEIKEYKLFKKNKELMSNFNRSGNDMAGMLEDQMSGRIDSWAIRWCYNQSIKNLMTIYPRHSMIFNNGNDLTGTHSLSTNKYDVKISSLKPKLIYEININDDITQEFKKFHDEGFSRHIKNMIKKLGLYRQTRKLRNAFLLAFPIKSMFSRNDN